MFLSIFILFFQDFINFIFIHPPYSSMILVKNFHNLSKTFYFQRYDHENLLILYIFIHTISLTIYIVPAISTPHDTILYTIFNVPSFKNKAVNNSMTNNNNTHTPTTFFLFFLMSSPFSCLIAQLTYSLSPP